jgi:hypothetical protein
VRCRTLSFNIHLRFDPDADLGWTSFTTLSLFYGQILIGKITLEDSHTIPDSWDKIFLEFDDIEIQNMNAFRSFIRHVIPQPRHGLELPDRAPAVALEIIESGHRLAMAMNLDNMGFAKALEPTIHLTGEEITITFRIHNPNKISIDFQQAEFRIQKDGQALGHTLAYLYGDLCTRKSHSTDGCVLKGSILVKRTELSGKAILKGYNLEGDYSWRIHALLLFEMEIDLDTIIYGDY